MSRHFLEILNGKNSGLLKRYIDGLNSEPRIAWYPSAGVDFRALIYLHPHYTSINKQCEITEPKSPDLFLFTDYFPWDNLRFLDDRLIYSDSRTIIQVDEIEELPRLNLPLHDELVHFPKGSHATNRILFLNIRIWSNQIGDYTFPVIYAFAENETFYCKKLIPHHATISHIIHVRYGGGLGGGGYASGGWILNVLKKLHCEVFLTDGQHFLQSGDEFAMKMCPSIPRENNLQLKPFRVINSIGWSDHGDVTWNLVE